MHTLKAHQVAQAGKLLHRVWPGTYGGNSQARQAGERSEAAKAKEPGGPKVVHGQALQAGEDRQLRQEGQGIGRRLTGPKYQCMLGSSNHSDGIRILSQAARTERYHMHSLPPEMLPEIMGPSKACL